MPTNNNSGNAPDTNKQTQASRKTPLWLGFLLPIISILIFFLLLEGGLAFFGVNPTVKKDDPFVGFASHSPLFLPVGDTNSEVQMVTAPNKKDFFNVQRFAREKRPSSYRIFTLGGSTTYGRPYDDSTSFSGWLRNLLPAVDQSKKWEVINAGGISYASYRIVKLMEELIQYEPDLFIIYTGHNEFLEERTYREIKEMAPLLRSTASLLQKTRTWTAMSNALESFYSTDEPEKNDRYKLGAEVDAILDRSVGLDGYHRDDQLQRDVINHFRLSLENMVKMAHSAGARVIFVSPASNLKDSSPFKSQDTPGISSADIQRAWEFWTMSKPMVWEKQWPAVVNVLNQAINLNPRHADLYFSRGQALFAMGQFEEAKEDFITARDEDVCPLRALTPMGKIVAEVAREQQVMLVDYEALLEKRLLEKDNHSILGEEYFLDHVHPTIEGHKLLATALLEMLASQGLASPETDWKENTLAAVSAKIEGAINPLKKGRALANLARVLLWAGKNDDAARLAKQALDVGGSYPEVADNAATSLATAYVRNGRPQIAVTQLYKYLEKSPNTIELRLKLGQILLDRKTRNLEEAVANLLLVTRQMPYYDWGHALFGIGMAERGRARIAYPSLTEALRLNPNNTSAASKLEQVRSSLAGQKIDTRPLSVQMTSYSSTAPHTLTQGRKGANGQFVLDGIAVEFHKNGRLKRFIDFDHGKVKNPAMTWDPTGKLISPQQ